MLTLTCIMTAAYHDHAQTDDINPLMGTLIKIAEQRTTIQQYSDWCTAADGWAVTSDTAKRGLEAPPRCTKCNSPPINGQCTNFILKG